MRLLSATQTAIVEHLAFSPDGSRLAAAFKKANVRVWEWDSSQPALQLKGTKDAQFVGFLTGPGRLIVASWNTPAVLWDLRARTCHCVGPKPVYCSDTVVSPDGTRVVRAEGPITCRDIADGRLFWQADYHNESGVRTCVRFNSDGSRLIVIGKQVSVRKAADGTELTAFELSFRRHATLYNADVSPDGRWAAFRGFEGMQVRDTVDGRLVFEEPSLDYGHSLAFTPDGARLAAGTSSGRQIDFWDVGTWRKGTARAPGIDTTMALTFSADGRLGAAGGFHGQVAVWEEK